MSLNSALYDIICISFCYILYQSEDGNKCKNYRLINKENDDDDNAKQIFILI